MSINIITHNINNLIIREYIGKNIFIVEDIFDDYNLCDDVIAIIDNLPLNYDYIKPKNNVECFYANMYDLLNTNEDYYYNFNLDDNIKTNFITNKLNGVSKEDIIKYNTSINKKMEEIINTLTKINLHINAYAHCGITLRKIYGKTQLHTDGITGSEIIDNDATIKTNRSLSVVISLNDNYDGGVFNFPLQNLSIKLKKNSAILFPPFWTHPHEVSEIKMNNRYTINTWILEDWNNNKMQEKISYV